MYNQMQTYKGIKRGLGENLILTFLHWVLVVVLSIASFAVQYAFLIGTDEWNTYGYFYGEIYTINYFIFFIGVALFLIGYVIIWKKCLAVDWKYFKGQFWLWKAAYIIFGLIAIFLVFMASILIMVLKMGMSGSIDPVWAEWGYMVFPAYVVLVSVIDLIVNRKKV